MNTSAQSPIRCYDTPGSEAEGKRPLRREVIERSGTSKLGLTGLPTGPSTYCSGTGSVFSDGACLGSDGDRYHAKTRLARRLAEAGAGKGVSPQGLRAPLSRRGLAISRRTVMNDAAKDLNRWSPTTFCGGG